MSTLVEDEKDTWLFSPLDEALTHWTTIYNTPILDVENVKMLEFQIKFA